MSADIDTLEPESDAAALAHPFVRELVALIRAQDRFGIWEKKPDTDLLAPYILDKDARRLLPIVGDPDPDLLARLEWFYGAIGLQVEKKTGVMASPMMKMSHEGFGRMIVTAGRLVVINKHLRDVHRFSFLSLSKLAEEGAKIVADAVDWIEKYPEVAKF